MNAAAADLTRTPKPSPAEGIKVAYGETLDHHTHYIVKKTTPNKLLLTAAARPVHVVSPTWFDALRIASKPPDPPSGPVPEPPAPRQPGEEAALYDKRVLKYERELLALDPDVGSDVPRWWGHSLLEKNWEAAWPAEADPRYYPTPWQDDEEPGIWKKNVARRTVFQNRLFASFSGSIDAVSTVPSHTKRPADRLFLARDRTTRTARLCSSPAGISSPQASYSIHPSRRTPPSSSN